MVSPSFSRNDHNILKKEDTAAADESNVKLAASEISNLPTGISWLGAKAKSKELKFTI